MRGGGGGDPTALMSKTVRWWSGQAFDLCLVNRGRAALPGRVIVDLIWISSFVADRMLLTGSIGRLTSVSWPNNRTTWHFHDGSSEKMPAKKSKRLGYQISQGTQKSGCHPNGNDPHLSNVQSEWERREEGGDSEEWWSSYLMPRYSGIVRNHGSRISGRQRSLH